MKRLLDALLAGTIASIVVPNVSGAEAATETIIYSFSNVLGTDGQAPSSGLIDVNGTLYGTTYFGSIGGIGTTDSGTLYSIDRKTGAETVLHSFAGASDGSYPLAGLIDVNGTLYGTTSSGGHGDCCGTVFAFDPSTGAETVVHAFNGTDGSGPSAGLMSINGILFGTTYYGGGGKCRTGNGSGCGTVFSINPRTGREKVLHAFQIAPSDGTYPTAGLIDVNGTLYGTTYYGGASKNCTKGSEGCGTIFAIDLATGAETVLHSFIGPPDGANPAAALIKAKGTLYGTTSEGGTGNCSDEFYIGCGTLFSLDPSTGTEKVLYSFTNDAGGSPEASLIELKGILYGTASSGDSCCGAVFSLDPSTGAETQLYSFRGEPDGAYPTSELINVKGRLYSTTFEGGAYGWGTVFSVTP